MIFIFIFEYAERESASSRIEKAQVVDVVRPRSRLGLVSS